MAEQKNRLINLYKYTYSGSSLLIVDIIKQTKHSSKGTFDSVICMINILPGVEGENGRTYDNTNKVTMKLNMIDLFSLGVVLKSPLSFDINNYNYSKFTKSESGSKILSVYQQIVDKQSPNKTNKHKFVFISISANKTKYGLKLDSYDAIALGEIITSLSQKGINEQFCLTANIDSSDQKKQYNNDNEDGFNDDPFADNKSDARDHIKKAVTEYPNTSTNDTGNVFSDDEFLE
jgi:hypothetical protein